jgi:hypothetical protein
VTGRLRPAPFAGTRPLKRWRYVGVYGPDIMLCAGCGSLAGVPQSFWAVWDRRTGTLRERTTWAGGRVRVDHDRVRVAARSVEVDLRLEADTAPWEAETTHPGGGWIWTRKQGARAVGTVRIDGVATSMDARAVIDDSAGYHARETRWEWCAGVGQDPRGRSVMWNLVTGLHDGASGSERAVWVDGVPREVGPVAFAEDLAEVRFAEGGALRFAAEAERARHDRLGRLFESEYRQPFGTFAGALPGGVTLASAYGVMERHHARW